MNEINLPPFEVAVHYMHKLLSDPSRVLQYVHNEEEAAELILSTLDSYRVAHSLDKETILAAIPSKKYRKHKSIKWEFDEGTADHIQVEINDGREYYIKSRSI